MTIKMRLVASVGLILAVSTLVTSGVMTVRSTDSAERAAHRYAYQAGARSAHELSEEVMAAVGTARDLTTVLGSLASQGATREAADSALRDLISAHPSYLGVWCGWEPDAFDGRDADYRDTPGHDATGRYIPYWVRTDQGVEKAPLVDYDKPGPGDYYQIPKNTGQEKLLEPFEYDVNGKPTLMTSVAVPIKRDDAVVGVAGVDLSLATLATTGGVSRPYAAARALLLSGAGAGVASGNGEEAGKAADASVTGLVRQALADGEQAQRIASWNGSPALQTAIPVKLSEVDTWALVLSIPTSAIFAEVNSTRWVNVLLAVASIALAILVMLLLARTIVRPIEQLRDRMVEIADGDGDLTQRVPVARDDEAGQLAAAFNHFVDKIAQTVRGITRAAGRLTDASAELVRVSGDIAQSAERSSERAATVSAGAEQVRGHVYTVSAGSEEMTASISEITQNATRSSQVAGSAVERISVTGDAVSKLGTSSAEIGSVLQLITSIAAQTHLLALNAAIEAARAGDAGKGFAVVASEVKELAEGTARATDDISRRVADIQSAAGEVVNAIGEIGSVVAQVNDHSATIAAAVEEQAATTAEMTRAISEAATGSTEIATAISAVAAAAADTTGGVEETRRSAENVATIATEIHTLVDRFRV
jgi:methyl-accepting chemotaxis protein